MERKLNLFGHTGWLRIKYPTIQYAISPQLVVIVIVLHGSVVV